ncbi:MAG: hypothetical protein V1754_01250, partial [Pseudomonadota bacterium]
MCNKTLVLIGLSCAVLCFGCKSKPLPKQHDLPFVKATARPVKILEVSFAGPSGHRPDRNFSRGEKILCLLSVTDFTHQNGLVNLAANIQVKGPKEELVLQQQKLELLEGKASTSDPKLVRSAARLEISPAAPPGKYVVHLLVKDLLGKRSGETKATFTLLGIPAEKRDRLSLLNVKTTGDTQIPAGSVMPISFTVAGFSTSQQENKYVVDLSITATVVNSAGKNFNQITETLKHEELSFSPADFPIEYPLVLPSSLSVGEYVAKLTVEDRISGYKTTGQVPIQIVPQKWGVYNMHMHDASGLPRSEFQLGEQAFVRFSVQGFATKNGEASLAVDMGVAGPDGGLYLAR